MCFFSVCSAGKHKRLCVRACVGLFGVRLEKYRLFYVALTLCFTLSFVGGWLNESFGLGLRYQKLWYGLGLGGWGGGGDVKGEGKANLYLWLLDSLCVRLRGDAFLPLSAARRAEHVRRRQPRMLAIIPISSVRVLSDMCFLLLYRGGSYWFVTRWIFLFLAHVGSCWGTLSCVSAEQNGRGLFFRQAYFTTKSCPSKIMYLLVERFFSQNCK